MIENARPLEPIYCPNGWSEPRHPSHVGSKADDRGEGMLLWRQSSSALLNRSVAVHAVTMYFRCDVCGLVLPASEYNAKGNQ